MGSDSGRGDGAAQRPTRQGTGLSEAWERAGRERVEVACGGGGGRGRTGTALACLAVLDGVPAVEAVQRS